MTAVIENPIALFSTWFEDAKATEPDVPDAMTLSTVDAEGMPNGRVVLLKGVDAGGEGGFVFFTNYESQKGVELAATPKAALTFHWKSLKRQVRVQGTISKTSTAESDAYFASRPRGSQIGAWASDQSRPLESLDALMAHAMKVVERFGDNDIPRPDHWGGYRLTPTSIEFWQDRADRLHERRRFTRTANNAPWKMTRLNP